MNVWIGGRARIPDGHTIKATIDSFTQCRMHTNVSSHAGESERSDAGRAQHHLQVRCIERAEPRLINNRLAHEGFQLLNDCVSGLAPYQQPAKWPDAADWRPGAGGAPSFDG